MKLALFSDNMDKSSELNNNDKQSDHLLMMVAYDKWVKILNEVCNKGIFEIRFTDVFYRIRII